MKKYNFHIVRAVRLQINHALCAVGGATMKDIKTVYSHPQALSQCAEFIKKAGLNAVEAENTATAAKELAERGGKSEAVLCSVECAEKYGLNILERSVQDNAFNYTRFIVISKDLELYPESDKISVLTSLSHEPGSLNRTLGKIRCARLEPYQNRIPPDIGYGVRIYVLLRLRRERRQQKRSDGYRRTRKRLG